MDVVLDLDGDRNGNLDALTLTKCRPQRAVNAMSGQVHVAAAVKARDADPVQVNLDVDVDVSLNLMTFSGCAQSELGRGWSVRSFPRLSP